MLSLAVAACGGDSTAGTDGGNPGEDGTSGAGALTLAVVSGRADRVTGGDALISLTATDADAVRITLNGDDVSDQFHPVLPAGHSLARLEGLASGENRIVATLGDAEQTLVLHNYPIAGPVFSGPHETPYYCTTEDFFLGAPLDADCTAKPVVTYLYGAADGTFKPLADPTKPPADIVQTTTSDGVTLDFIVRVEAGTINRAIYWITSLYDPAAPPAEPWQPSPAWNHKLFYFFGGGCGTGHAQGDPNYALASSYAFVLAQGHAMLHSSLNTLGYNCNDVLSAETAMMVKEHFIEHFGVPIYTVGLGGSGGSIQQHLIADNYPGILDGLLPTLSFPDIWSVFPDIVDCRLLVHYFADNAALWPDPEAQRAVTGYASLATCMGWEASYANLIDADDGCLAKVPASAIYDPSTNPDGIRCTLQDHNINIFGVDPDSGFARRPYDNTGVEYGLAALRSGAISADQFLDLNAEIGGFDSDGERVAARSRAAPEAIQIAYRTGRILDAGQGLAQTPIIDVRAYLDDSGNIHDAFRTLSLRARLVQANGDAQNQVAFFYDPEGAGAAASAASDAFVLMDQWLVALAADPDDDRRAAMLRARPAALADRCYLSAEPTPGLCPDTLTPHQSPRRVAGAPLANDIIQCALAPIDPADYPSFTPAQLDQLNTIFPDGVCDFSAPPPNRVPPAGPWRTFGPAPAP